MRREEKRLTKKLKAILLLLSTIAILTAAVAGTVAWLQDFTGPIDNTFVPGKVPIEIIEEFDSKAKSDVRISNNGNVDAYVRVAVIAAWYDGDNATALPTAGTFTFELNTTNWTRKDDDYYYYNGRLSPGALTENLLDGKITASVDLAKNPEYKNKKLRVDVIASSLQADGWGSGVTDAYSAFLAASNKTS